MSFSREVFENWFALQRQMIAGLQRAYVRVQGPAVPDRELVLRHPAGPDSTGDDLALAARLAEQSQAPVTSTLKADQQTSLVRIAFPFTIETQVSGSIVVESSVPLAQQAALNQLLQWGATWLGALLNVSGDTPLESDCTGLALVMQTYPDYAPLLTAILATLKQSSGADRVACGIERKGKVSLEGISEIVDLDRRSPHARAIVTAMQEATGEVNQVAWFRDSAVEEPYPAHAGLANLSDSEQVVTSRLPGVPGENFVFTFEFSGKGSGSNRLADHCRSLATLSTTPLALRRQHEGGWLRRLVRTLAEGLSNLISPLHRWRRIVYIAGALVLLALLLNPTDYRITAKARIEAASQQTVAVPFESYIAEAYARAGEKVTEGALLARLEDRELKTRQRGLLAEAAELRKKHRQAMATGKLSEARVLEARFEQTSARLSLVEEQLQQTEIRSPLDGIVISGDWQRDIGAPVTRGDTLFELAPLNSYRTVLLVEDRDIVQLTTSQHGEIVLAAMPSHPLKLHVSDIVSIADAEELTAVFRVEAILQEEPSSLRPGMEGVAKIVAGERPRWWVWSHDLVEWLRLQWWRWLP